MGPFRFTSRYTFEEWTEQFTARFGHPPSALALATYDAVLCVALAAEAADSTKGTETHAAFRGVSGGEGEIITATTSNGVDKALDAIRSGRDINHEGLSCSMDLTRSGDLACGDFRDLKRRL